MARAATARSAPAPARAPRPRRAVRPARPPASRRAPKRLSPAPRRRSGPAAGIRPRGSAVLDSLLRGKGWIALVGVLLTGIVFFNVDLLELNRGIAKDAERASALKRENSVLRTQVAQLGSTERIQRAAVRLGLVLPQPGEIRYLRAHPSVDARRAAQSIEAPAPRGAPPPTDNA